MATLNGRVGLVDEEATFNGRFKFNEDEEVILIKKEYTNKFDLYKYLPNTN